MSPITRTPRPRPGARAITFVVAAAISWLLPTGAGAASRLVITIEPVGQTSVAQGVRFGFRTTAENPGSRPSTVTVTFELLRPGGGPFAFRTWTVTVPPFESVTGVADVVPARWFAALGSYAVVPTVQGRPAADPLAFEVTAATVLVPRFRDVTAASGISTALPPSECGAWASGAAWGDADGDGDLDLYVPVREAASDLWINDGTGHFAEQAALRGVADPGGRGLGATFADFDGDGDEDLYVVRDGPNRLYANDGAGHFTDVAPAAGVDDGGVGPSAAWGDVDADGYLDLYVVNHQRCHDPGQPDRLYHNEADGTFTDWTDMLPGSTNGAGYQAAWFDFDGDGDQDLYLANDTTLGGPEANWLWRNDGPAEGGGWTFTDVSEASGTKFAIKSMGIAVGDYDGDLDLDFAVSNIGPTVLARNEGDGTFTEVAGPAGVARPWQGADLPSVTWGLAFADLDLDGREDLYVAAGSLYDLPPQPNELFVNDGMGSFLDLSAPSGADDQGSSRGLALVDFERDGRVDLFVVDEAGTVHLLRNVTSTAGRHWMEVDPVGRAGNRHGCGARLIALAGGRSMVREVYCGSTGLASGSDPVVHFGLGASSIVERLTIEWPSGATQTLTGLRADRSIRVPEP